MVFFYIALEWFLFYVMENCISSASENFSEVIDLAAVCTLLPIGQTLSGWNCKNCSPSLWVLWHMFVHFSHCIWVPLLLSLPCQTLVMVKPSIIADWALWASTLFAQPNTCSLVISALSLALVSSLIISASISLSLSPCMNCSFNCLSTSL